MPRGQDTRYHPKRRVSRPNSLLTTELYEDEDEESRGYNDYVMGKLPLPDRAMDPKYSFGWQMAQLSHGDDTDYDNISYGTGI